MSVPILGPISPPFAEYLQQRSSVTAGHTIPQHELEMTSTEVSPPVATPEAPPSGQEEHAQEHKRTLGKTLGAVCNALLHGDALWAVVGTRADRPPTPVPAAARQRSQLARHESEVYRQKEAEKARLQESKRQSASNSQPGMPAAPQNWSSSIRGRFRLRRTSGLSQSHGPEGQEEAANGLSEKANAPAKASPAGYQTISEESDDDVKAAVKPVDTTDEITATPSSMTGESSTLCSSISTNANGAQYVSHETSTESAMESAMPPKESSRHSLNRTPRTTRKASPASSAYSSQLASNTALDAAMSAATAPIMTSACDTTACNTTAFDAKTGPRKSRA
ncbi:MAG: hypothetical protein Q9222_002064 [Ikaeria aurantiellina]